MPEPLVISVQRYLDDPEAFERRLGGRGVLVYDPPEPDDDESTDADYRFRTVSGVKPTEIGQGEPVVVYLEKNKDNAMRSRVTVGRTSNNDVVLDDASVSRFHAWFERQADGTWLVADAGSKNGTSLHGAPLAPKKAVPLPNGAKLTIGNLELTYFGSTGFLKFLRARMRPG